MVKTESRMLELGTQVPAFSLPDTTGDIVDLSMYEGRPLLVMFICNHCPYVRHIRSQVALLGNEYLSKGVGVVAINSNDSEAYPDDSPAAMVAQKVEFGYEFPYLIDESQAGAKAFSAACTPDFFLFGADHLLVYRGQLDDSRPSNDIAVTGRDLRSALDAVLAGQPVSSKQLPSMGCNIKWRPGNEPAYFSSGLRLIKA